ncbi:MAG: YceD family protein [Halioglobus sp.]
MLTEPLPTMLDIRKAAGRGASVRGSLKPADLRRFRPLLAGDEGDISVEMSFAQDEENRCLVHVVLKADVIVTCQRCLEQMPEHLSSDSTLAVVWTDAEAAHLPKHLEPLVVTEPSSNLWEVAEEELILALRPFSYHDSEDCGVAVSANANPAPAEHADQERPNPFDVLGQLKPRK